MDAEERLAQLKAENAALLSELTIWQRTAKEQREQLAQAMARVRELEEQPARTSHNSHKPSWSAGFARQMMGRSKPGGKKNGGQPGSEGRLLLSSVIVSGVFVALAIPLSVYILSLPLSQITGEYCSGFSAFQLSNCLAFYQRQGEAGVLQQEAQIALGILWIGLLIGGACAFFVFPRISLSGTLKGILLFIALLSALLLAGAPLYLFARPMTYGFCFALSLIIGYLACGLFLASSTKKPWLQKDLHLPGSENSQEPAC